MHIAFAVLTLKAPSYYTPANEVWEGVYRSHRVGWLVGWSVGCSVPFMFVERTTFTLSARLVSNLACVILMKCRCAWHIFCDCHVFPYWVICPWYMHLWFIIWHITHACLWSELLLHFSANCFQTWHVSSVRSVCVRDIFFVSNIFFLTELPALEKCWIFNIEHACLWSELLLHFLPDWF